MILGQRLVFYQLVLVASAALGIYARSALAVIPVGFYPVTVANSTSTQINGGTPDGSRFVGTIVRPDRTGQIFFWDPVGGTQLVPEPAGAWVAAADISADGTTVVGHMSSTFLEQAYRWTSSGGYEPLGTLSADLGFNYSYASSVSADGSVVVGLSQTSNSEDAFRWERSTGMVDLGTLGTSNPFYPARSAANRISGDGSMIIGGTTVVGLDEQQMARWNKATGWENLGSVPESPRSAQATGMNTDGSIVVGSDQGANYYGTIWTAAAGVQALPQLAGYSVDSADHVSDDGRLITGYVTSPQRAVVWLKIGGSYQIELADDYLQQLGFNLLGWKIANVTSLSPDGRIWAGSAVDATGLRHGYVAVLPVPEPTGIFVVSIALGALTVVRPGRKRRHHCHSRKGKEGARPPIVPVQRPALT
jgi:probable HAF family extracellular repeat protein